MKEYTKKEASLLQEKEVAKLVNGEVQIASGALSHGGGDVLTENWFLECKTVISKKDSYSVKKSILDKMYEQSFEQQKNYSSLAFRFSPEGEDYFVVNSETFKHMMKSVNLIDKYSNYFNEDIETILSNLDNKGSAKMFNSKYDKNNLEKVRNDLVKASQIIANVLKNDMPRKSQYCSELCKIADTFETFIIDFDREIARGEIK